MSPCSWHPGLCTCNTPSIWANTQLSAILLAWYMQLIASTRPKQTLSKGRSLLCGTFGIQAAIFSCYIWVTDSAVFPVAENPRLITLCRKVKKSWKQFSVSVVPRVQEQSSSPLPIFFSMPCRLSRQNPSWWCVRSGSHKHLPRWNCTHENPTDFN